VAELVESLESLCRIGALVDAAITQVTVRPGLDGYTCEVAVARNELARLTSMESLRMGAVGEEGSGKSTLIGVLASGTLDDARGLARMKVLRHNHEVESGRTSSISATLLGFDGDGQVVNHRKSLLARKPLQAEIVRDSDRVLTVFDCAGHEKYLKTTVFGISANDPDYILLVIDANRGIQKMTREHLGVALALQLPLVVVITKCDVADGQAAAPDGSNPRLARTWAQVQRILRSPAAGNRKCLLVRSYDDVAGACRALRNDLAEAAAAAADDAAETRAGPGAVPCFHVSNVTGAGLGFLRAFLAQCPHTRAYKGFDRAEAGLEVRLEDVFHVEGEGTVFSGSVRAGAIEVNDKLLLGPLDGWVRVCVQSIHVNGVPSRRALCGQALTLTLSAVPAKASERGSGAGPPRPKLNHSFDPNSRRGLKLLRARKGLVLLDARRQADMPSGVREFDAEVVLLHHPNGIVSGYEPVIHAESVQQSARLVEIIPVETYEKRKRALSGGSADEDVALLKAPRVRSGGDEPPRDVHGVPTFSTPGLPTNAAPRADEAPAIRNTHVISDSEDDGTTWEARDSDGAECSVDEVEEEEAREGGADESEDEEEAILPGGKAICRFRFKFRPEFVVPGTKILFREGTTRGVGQIISVKNI